MNGENDDITAHADGVDSEQVKTLGTTEVSRGGRISLVTGVREAFAERGVDVETVDRLVYRLRDGHIVIESDETPSNP